MLAPTFSQPNPNPNTNTNPNLNTNPNPDPNSDPQKTGEIWVGLKGAISCCPGLDSVAIANPNRIRNPNPNPTFDLDNGKANAADKCSALPTFALT